MVLHAIWFHVQFSAFNLNCCICYIDGTFEESFVKLHLDRDDVIDALREVKEPPKMKKKGRPRGAETTVIELPQAKKQRGVISKSKPFSKSLSGKCARDFPFSGKGQGHTGVLYNQGNVVAAAIDGSRLLPIDDLFGLQDTARDTRYKIQLVMKILIFIAQRNILIY